MKRIANNFISYYNKHPVIDGDSMTEQNPSHYNPFTPSRVIVGGATPSLINTTYFTELATAATDAAITGALDHGVDMPVGAALGYNGTILTANYAQDNLLHDNRAHAEFMALEQAQHEYPAVQPDTVAVTLEPCASCQDYLAQYDSIKTVIFTMPLATAALQRVVRRKTHTIFQRHQ